MWFWGNVSSQTSKLCQRNLMENAKEALAFRKVFLENQAKGFFTELIAVLNSDGTSNLIKI